ncbi:TonB-dependent receptor plug domain-containing protein [Pseudoxanthomonas sp. 10H]|uniref:TonB-dependent receptor plug domain-containing protein n=1 Tax=Pseudoxanthomonas sp. 10H TaxID=3242729 RepID=UPI00355776FA
MTRHRSPLALALLAALATPAAPALAQETTAGDDRAASTLDTVIVTGTRVADRTVAESTSPIDVITPQALQATGTTELATALARAVPSLNFPRPALVDGTDAVRPAQLRGLSPDQTLVLVNGKRRHKGALINVNGSQGRGSAPVDLNAIPIASIARVEVLRDGASAQYGSDAIAGVVNIVLKGNETSGSLQAQYGQYSAGDGAQYQVSGDGGLALGEGGWLHLAAQAGHQDQTDRARPYLGANPGTGNNPPAGRVVQRFGDPDVDQGGLAFSGEYSPQDGITFYSFGTYSRRDVTSTGFFRPATAPTNIPSIYPDGYLPQIRNDTEDTAVVAGFRGFTAGGLDVDFSYNYGSNDLGFEVGNSLNRSLGTATPTEFDAGSLRSTQHVLNADFSRTLDWGLAYPVALAFGAEWRGEEFVQSAGEPASYQNGGVVAPGETTPRPGAQVFPGFSPGDAGRFDRNSLAAYVDLEADLSDRLSVGLAGRYEDFSDFGDTASGKLSARYAFTDKVALRGTVSNGFRAPSLQQQFYQYTSSSFISGVQYAVRTFRVDDPVAVELGAEPLRAEESDNYSLGLVLQPVDALYLTIDAYRIEIDDRIVLSENLVSTPVANYLIAQGYSATGGRYFTNAIDTTTRGVDVVGTYRWDLDGSDLALTAGYNWNETEIDRIAANPPSLAAIDPNAVRFGRAEIGRITEGSPHDKFFLNGVWNLGNWSFNATATRYGEFTVRHNTVPAQDQTFDPEWTLDLAVSYALDRWEFTVGGDNVFNAYPDEVLYANSSSGQLPYSSSSPFGFNGGFVYARAGYRW